MSTPLHHPPQFEMPHQTPSARPEYLPHSGMWCPFCFCGVLFVIVVWYMVQPYACTTTYQCEAILRPCMGLIPRLVLRPYI